MISNLFSLAESYDEDDNEAGGDPSSHNSRPRKERILFINGDLKRIAANDRASSAAIEGSYGYDVAIVLDAKESLVTANDLAAALSSRKPGLIVRVCSLKHCKALLITATPQSLIEWAEDFRMVKRERESGHLVTFIASQLSQFENSETPENFFSQTERQQLIQLTIESVRVEGEVETYGKQVLQRGQPIISHLKLEAIVRHFFPLHCHDDLRHLRNKWASPLAIRFKQPLDDICAYFDSSIAYYFAWLEFYTKWLWLPAIFGFLAWLFASSNRDTAGDEGGTSDAHLPNSTVFLLLILFNTVWFAFFRKFWQRRSNALAFRWGAIDHRMESDEYFAEPRPLFTGTPAINPVTGKPTLNWPSWRRSVIVFFVSVPVTIVCLLLMLVASVVCLSFEKYSQSIAEGWPAPIDSLLSLLPLIFFVCVLNIFNDIYVTVATKLNDLENHFSQNDYVKQLQAKLIVFRFFNSFLPLFYTAFYERDFARLQEQVAALVMLRQIAGNASELLLPYLTSRYQQFSALRNKTAEKRHSTVATTFLPFIQVRRNRRTSVVNALSGYPPKLNDNEPKLQLLNQVQEESLLQEFDDCFEDYLEMFCQVGYIMMFTVAFPPVAFWCLLNNLVELKTDALKMCSVYRRPFARERVRDIGIWTDAFNMLAVFAIVVNIALIANFNVLHSFCSHVPDNNKAYSALLGVVVVEHVIFASRTFANHVVKDLPTWINIELAKREYALLKERTTK